MTAAETRLADLWAATSAPPRDLAFVLALEERIARRLLFIDVAGRIAVGLVLIVAVAVFGPALMTRASALAPSLDAAGPVLAAVAALGAVMVRLIGLPEDVFSREREENGGA